MCLICILGKRVIRRVRHGGLLPAPILDPSRQVRLPQLRDLKVIAEDAWTCRCSNNRTVAETPDPIRLSHVVDFLVVTTS